MRGFVQAVDRGRYTCATEGGTTITAMGARELGRRGVVVGDAVALVGDLSGKPGSLARIVKVHKRDSELRRSTDDGDATERIVVANARQLFIVASLADPPPRTGLIDRCLVAAEDAGIQPLLLLTKSDLVPDSSASDMLAYYRALDLPHLVWRHDQSVDQVAAHLGDTVSVLVGHSGVGKSTLVNALVPQAHRATGTVSGVGKGRHTSTSVQALALPDGGWVIDTPGIRSFGLAHIPPEDLVHGFADLLPGSLECEAGCDHSERQPSCALDAWCAAGNAPVERLASFRSLLTSFTQ